MTNTNSMTTSNTLCISLEKEIVPKFERSVLS